MKPLVAEVEGVKGAGENVASQKLRMLFPSLPGLLNDAFSLWVPFLRLMHGKLPFIFLKLRPRFEAGC